MNKLKTSKTLKKRFKISSGGKIQRKHQNSGHRKSHKSKARIRAYKVKKFLNTSQAKFIKRMIS
ncbi:hypothetical protein A2960_02065 [Candidatus Gottesmanbacteria bacterium RIFCSPLOWO2_01_FULL_39_12b]|uniref:Large ribosomal subunit protein bL35 n=1 Tax=Candidatus Gottesmanbacteria bacterium RIFCSPLOWO2_01_FULL_39_12b TaxID=1798388 RepID=A0A1F6AQD9_9BACT|nr:MAG: hypothetical protein A2960_02065 [Candidatus Gottesmanbacteria bacterium RIFCSPLOWO2_01_FULL_39_12b]